MKAGFHQRIVAALFAITAGLAIGPALADPLHDCTDGCWIVTCQSGQCTLWRCDANGCTSQAEFPAPETIDNARSDNGLQSDKTPEAGGKKPSRTGPTEPAAGIYCGTQRCAVKVCDELHCSIFGLSGGNARLLGTHDNVDAILEQIGKDFLTDPEADPDVE